MKTINNSITEDYVNFDNAKLLKEKGFEVAVKKYFRYDKKECENNPLNWNEDVGFFSRPTIQLAVKWIEVNFNIDIQVICNYSNKGIKTYRVGIIFLNNKNQIDTKFLRPKEDTDKFNFIEFENRQEAYNAAIKYCLTELIK